MNCQQRINMRSGWRRWLPPNPFGCEFCGYYVIGFVGAWAVTFIIILACLTQKVQP